MSKVVVDSGPLIHLARINNFDLLRRVFGKIYIPDAVYELVSWLKIAIIKEVIFVQIFKSLKMVTTVLLASVPILAVIPTATLTQPQPPQMGGDLIIKEITIEPESPKPGDMVIIIATVLNQDQKDVDSSFNVQLVISLGPPELSAIGLGEMGGIQVGVQRVRGGLDAGEERKVEFQWKMIELPLFKTRVIADSPFDSVGESDEENNELEKVIRIESRYINQWWLDKIDVKGAWEITKGSEEIVVAVVDSGVDYIHPELNQSMWINSGEVADNGVDDDDNGFVDDVRGWDFVDHDNDSLKGTQIETHGTAVASLIAGADDGRGTAGVAPKVKIMDLRVLGTEGWGRWSNTFKAIEYAVENGADIINMSLSSPYSKEEADEDRQWFEKHAGPILEKAAEKGVIIVESAGNESQEVGWLARFDSVIAVSATTKDNDAAEYSNFGREIDVAAPGGSLSWAELKAKLATARSLEDVLPVVNDLLITPWIREYYGWFAGTSASAPIVSGTIALLLSIKPDLNLEQIREIFKATSTDLEDPGKDDRFGYGLINTARAVGYLSQPSQEF